MSDMQAELLAGLRALTVAAERDLLANQDDDGPGGNWSLATENAIRNAKHLIAKAEAPATLGDAVRSARGGDAPSPWKGYA